MKWFYLGEETFFPPWISLSSKLKQKSVLSTMHWIGSPEVENRSPHCEVVLHQLFFPLLSKHVSRHE